MACNSDQNITGFTLENLKALEDAIASGVKRVKYTDKEIEYQSRSDMDKTRAQMRRALGLSKVRGRKGLFGGLRIIGRHSKGL